MEVRYGPERDTMVLKSVLKEGKEGKEVTGSLSKSLMKEPQDSFSGSGTGESCENTRGSTGDPDYCRRILVRGERRRPRFCTARLAIFDLGFCLFCFSVSLPFIFFFPGIFCVCCGSGLFGLYPHAHPHLDPDAGTHTHTHTHTD